jgi:CTP synthase (UTP-ammonia lyase)
MELMNTAAGNNPSVVKLFARLGAEVTEDMTQNTQNNNLAVSRLDAQDEIAQIYANNSHPYFNAAHPEHRAAVERVRQLHEKVYGA